MSEHALRSRRSTTTSELKRAMREQPAQKNCMVEQDGRMRGARAAPGLIVALLSVVIPIPAYAQEHVIETALKVPGTREPDGKPVELDVSILTTDPSTPRPAIVLAHGFGGTNADSEPTARTLALAGYTVIIYTARGFGASGGLIHLDNPAYEGADARKLVDFAASRPEIAKNGDDPVIGFAGASYGERSRCLPPGWIIASMPSSRRSPGTACGSRSSRNTTWPAQPDRRPMSRPRTARVSSNSAGPHCSSPTPLGDRIQPTHSRKITMGCAVDSIRLCVRAICAQLKPVRRAPS